MLRSPLLSWAVYAAIVFVSLAGCGDSDDARRPAGEDPSTINGPTLPAKDKREPIVSSEIESMPLDPRDPSKVVRRRVIRTADGTVYASGPIPRSTRSEAVEDCVRETARFPSGEERKQVYPPPPGLSAHIVDDEIIVEYEFAEVASDCRPRYLVVHATTTRVPQGSVTKYLKLARQRGTVRMPAKSPRFAGYRPDVITAFAAHHPNLRGKTAAVRIP